MKKESQTKANLSICAPSSPFAKKDFLLGVKWVKSLGLEVSFSEDVFQCKGHLAGPDQVRAGVLLRSLRESDIIVAARGGGGCGRLYPLIKKGLAAVKPYSRTIIGSSDATFLYLFSRSLSPQVFVYGPMACRYGSEEFKGFEKKVMEAVFRGTTKFPLSYPGRFSIAKEGKAIQGRLDGGNLSILASSLGTPYEWAPKGPVLYIEDVNEPLYRIDRMLTQLAHAGKFNGFKAALIGRIDGPASPAWNTLKECLLEHFGKIEGPVLARIPTGHGKTQWPFFLGGEYSVGRGIICLNGYC